MAIMSILLSLLAAQPMPVQLLEPWTIEVGPGSLHVGEHTLTLTETARLPIAPPSHFIVRDECYSDFPVFNEKTAGWVKGARFRALIAQECTGAGLLFPETVKVKPAPGDATPYALGADYAVDPFWGTLGRIEGGAIGHRQTVFIDYEHDLSRIDTVFIDPAGKLRLVEGRPAVALAMPPQPLPGETALVNIYVRGGIKQLERDNLYPICFAPATPPATPQAETLLPKTLAKLRAGETVTIVAFGDSVTNGGGANTPEDWYQNQFLVRLRERFPKATIRMLSAAWGGASSKAYLEAPRGGTYDFIRDVLEPKPDLVTIEFVNDAYLDEQGVADHYAGILGQIRNTGAEVALITPHLVRPDWMNAPDTMFTEDPRPYVKGLKQFANKNNVALADASATWCQLRQKGIPYITLLANNINHPDQRGHKIFADALMGLFPEN